MTDTISKEAGRQWVREMPLKDVFELGDHLVLGIFDWTEWLEAKPGRRFLAGAEEERIYREQMGE
jgi:hypothetical protein